MSKIISLIGLSRRAGKLVMGYDAVVMAVKKKTAILVIIASDVSEKTKKNTYFECEKCGVSVIQINETMEELETNLRKKVGVLAITDKGFASGIVKAYENADVRKDDNII